MCRCVSRARCGQRVVTCPKHAFCSLQLAQVIGSANETVEQSRQPALRSMLCYFMPVWTDCVNGKHALLRLMQQSINLLQCRGRWRCSSFSQPISPTARGSAISIFTVYAGVHILRKYLSHIIKNGWGFAGRQSLVYMSIVSVYCRLCASIYFREHNLWFDTVRHQIASPA